MKIPSTSRWILLGVASYLILALVSLPASVMLKWLAPPSLTATQVAGSAWNGSASTISIDSIQATDVHWKFKPLALVTLKAGASVNAKIAGGRAEADVFTTLFGNSGRIDNLHAVLDVAALSQLAQIPAQVDGKVGVQLDRLAWKNSRLTQITGNVTLADMIERLNNNRIGTIDVTFPEEQSGGITGIVTDSDATFTINGTISLDEQNAYQFDAVIEPTAATPADITNALQLFGSQPDRQGNFTLAYAGTL